MVRGYDTTKSDVSKFVLDYLFGVFDSNKINISVDKATDYLKYWIANSQSTSSVYKKFEDLIIKPKIYVRKRCPKPYYQYFPYEGDQNFGAFEQNGDIHICMKNITNKIELKQNLDRQLYIQYYTQISKNQSESPSEPQTQKDKIQINNIYKGCLKGYENYGWQKSTLQRVSKKCAIYLFRRRTSSNLPPDSLFRYAARLADEVIV